MRNGILRVGRIGLALGIAATIASCAVVPERRPAPGDVAPTQDLTQTAPAFQDEPPPVWPRWLDRTVQTGQAYEDAMEAWLAPPPSDLPQPKLVCQRPEYDAEPVWYDQPVTFAWEIANAGAAPLRIRLKP